jgi:hypothetical protein
MVTVANQAVLSAELFGQRKPGPLGQVRGTVAMPVKIAGCIGVLKHYKISNSKHQITNKSQIPIFNDQNGFGISNFGHCNLFDICDL